jgi:hypothetical protein
MAVKYAKIFDSKVFQIIRIWDFLGCEIYHLATLFGNSVTWYALEKRSKGSKYHPKWGPIIVISKNMKMCFSPELGPLQVLFFNSLESGHTIWKWIWN